MGYIFSIVPLPKPTTYVLRNCIPASIRHWVSWAAINSEPVKSTIFCWKSSADVVDIRVHNCSKLRAKKNRNSPVICVKLRNFVKHYSQVSFTGVGVGFTGVPSCTQVAFSPGWVHIRFSHSCSWSLSHPLCDAFCLFTWTVTVLLLSFPLPSLSLYFMSSTEPIQVDFSTWLPHCDRLDGPYGTWQKFLIPKSTGVLYTEHSIFIE